VRGKESRTRAVARADDSRNVVIPRPALCAARQDQQGK
jgi:hypothetical protein